MSSLLSAVLCCYTLHLAHSLSVTAIDSDIWNDNHDIDTTSGWTSDQTLKVTQSSSTNTIYHGPYKSTTVAMARHFSCTKDSAVNIYYQIAECRADSNDYVTLYINGNSKQITNGDETSNTLSDSNLEDIAQCSSTWRLKSYNPLSIGFFTANTPFEVKFELETTGWDEVWVLWDIKIECADPYTTIYSSWTDDRSIETPGWSVSGITAKITSNSGSIYHGPYKAADVVLSRGFYCSEASSVYVKYTVWRCGSFEGSESVDLYLNDVHQSHSSFNGNNVNRGQDNDYLYGLTNENCENWKYERISADDMSLNGIDLVPYNTVFDVRFDIKSDSTSEYWALEDITITCVPTPDPTVSPTPQTPSPTDASKAPTLAPSTIPTASPTLPPTVTSISPTSSPTTEPTLLPTVNPTDVPTYNPTASPTLLPTVNPTDIPTYNPTASPTGPIEGRVDDDEKTDASDSDEFQQQDVESNTNPGLMQYISEYLLYIIIGGGTVLVCCIGICVYCRVKRNKAIAMNISSSLKKDMENDQAFDHEHVNSTSNIAALPSAEAAVDTTEAQPVWSMPASQPITMSLAASPAVFGATLDNLGVVNNVLMGDVIDDMEVKPSSGGIVTAGGTNNDDTDVIDHETARFDEDEDEGTDEHANGETPDTGDIDTFDNDDDDDVMRGMNTAGYGGGIQTARDTGDIDVFVNDDADSDDDVIHGMNTAGGAMRTVTTVGGPNMDEDDDEKTPPPPPPPPSGNPLLDDEEVMRGNTFSGI